VSSPPTAARTSRRPHRIIGYLCALGAGATWGTTGPLSTGLYKLMPATSIGFWRVLVGTIALAGVGMAFAILLGAYSVQLDTLVVKPIWR
jgi:drug/metabolite transporter (DMT)-like permease